MQHNLNMLTFPVITLHLSGQCDALIHVNISRVIAGEAFFCRLHVKWISCFFSAALERVFKWC